MEHFKTHLPDIVITDISKSEICGVQMSKNIRSIKPDTKFIAITGKSLDEIIFNFDLFIVKPVAFQTLFGIIEQCFDKIVQQTDQNFAT